MLQNPFAWNNEITVPSGGAGSAQQNTKCVSNITFTRINFGHRLNDYLLLIPDTVSIASVV
jgi:hypothetical protein